MERKRKNSEELLLSFHTQFAENQNHHQKLLVQFISAMAIVVVGYTVVYTNMTTDAYYIDVLRDKESKIISYSIFHLVFSYFIAQLILSMIIFININIGYGFRRDQLVNYNIRKKYIPQSEYDEIFGKLSFKPTGKKIKEYLPNFNYIFYKYTILIKLILLVSVVLLFPSFNIIPKSLMRWPIIFFATVLISMPLLFDGFLFESFHRKYRKIVCKEKKSSMIKFRCKRIKKGVKATLKRARTRGQKMTTFLLKAMPWISRLAKTSRKNI